MKVLKYKQLPKEVLQEVIRGHRGQVQLQLGQDEQLHLLKKTKQISIFVSKDK